MTTQDPELSAALGWPGGISDPVLDRKALLQMVAALRLVAQQALEALRHVVQQAQENLVPTIHYGPVHDTMNNLRAALAQQAEPLNLRDPAVQKRLVTQWGYVPAAQAEPDLSRCPQCNGPADNGFDRSIPPNPYLCTKCIAEPVEPVEPVAWECKAGGLKPLTQRQYDAQTAATKRHYTRIAPPQRTMVPLSEDEIWALYFSLPSDDFEQSDRVDFARAVEQASWEKNHGQA